VKELKHLLYKVNLESVVGKTTTPIQGIAFDSREVKAGFLFVALKGVLQDGHEYMDQAIASGAVAILCESLPKAPPPSIVFIEVENSHKALGTIAANFYDNPSEKLSLIGVTGTNGKTTVVSLLYNLFMAEGYPTGLLSTVVIRYNNTDHPTLHTTPDALSLNRHLAAMVEAGISHCFMEVSSHGIAQHRTHGLHFRGGVFTNLTHDHLDYHGDFKSYRDMKKRFFDALPQKAFALTNSDDKNGAFMLQNTKAKKYHYAQQQHADFRAQVLENSFSGMLLKFDQQEVWTPLVGTFNAQNLLAVYGVAKILDLDLLNVLRQFSTLNSVPGRFQTFTTQNKTTVVVDYAHTPDALENVLKTINSIRTKNETLITIVGCGGNRDQEKRPLMGKMAAALSDKVIFTSDNPRDEDPAKIIAQMMKGVGAEYFKRVMKITPREEAIAAACQLSQPGDVILIAGKGHENYQEIAGKRLPFDDFQIAQQIFLNPS